MPGMLYYPGMTPPDDVLNHAALYWDTVSTIAPIEYEKHLRPSLRLAWESGIYRPVSTRGEHDFGHSFHKSFTYLLPALEKRLGLNQLIPDESEIDGFDAPEDMLWYSTSRFPPELTAKLLDYGLAHPRDGASVWVKPAVHYLVFALAAEHVTSNIRQSGGVTSAANLFAYTDRERCFWLGHSPLGELHPRPCWQVEIGELLPQPAPGTSLADVIAFRQRYDDERRALLGALGKLQADLHQRWANSVDVREFAKDDLANAVSNLRKAALASKLRLVARSTLVFVAVATAATEAAVPPSISFVLGVTSAIAVNLATGTLGGVAGDQAYTYLHRAGKTLSAR